MYCLKDHWRSFGAAVLLVLLMILTAGCLGDKGKNGTLPSDGKAETLKITADELLDLLGIEDNDFHYGKVMVDFDEPMDIKILVETKSPGNVGVGVSTTRAEIAKGTILVSVLEFSKLGADMPDKMRVCVSITEIDRAGVAENRSSTVYTQQDIFAPETSFSYWAGPAVQRIEKPGRYGVLSIMTAAGLESGKRMLSGARDYVPKVDEGMLRVTAVVAPKG